MTTRRAFLVVATAFVLMGVEKPPSARAHSEIPDGSTIVLVRHADKMSGQGDVALSPAGMKRRDALMEVLKNSSLSVIVRTNALRSKETTKLIADKLKLVPVEIKRSSTEQNDMEQAVRANLPGVALVVGHSETLPGLIEALGGPNVEVNTFDNLFVIVRARGVTQFIRGRYGAASN